MYVCRKSQKISTASDQYFLSYVKKLQGGGQIDPPPAGIGLTITDRTLDVVFQDLGFFVYNNPEAEELRVCSLSVL